MVIGRPSARAPSQSRLICSIVRTPRDARRRRAADGQRAEIARADAQREQIVLVGHPVLLDARQAGEIHRRVVGEADGRAVGEPSADAHVAHGRQFGVGVLGAARVVRPVVHRGDAGGERLGGAETDGAIAVLGLHQRSEAGGHREIAERGNVGADEEAEQGVPQVEMRIDEAGNADHAGAVDDLRGWRLDLLGDRDDGPVADMHVAAARSGTAGSMVSTVAPRMRSSPRPGSGAPGALAVRAACCADRPTGMSAAVPNAAAPCMSRRRLKLLPVI